MTLILPPEARKLKKKKRTASSVKPNRTVESNYRKNLNKLLSLLTEANKNIGNLVAGGAGRREISNVISQEVEKTNRAFNNNAQLISNSFVSESSSKNKTLMQNSIKRALGLSFVDIVDDDNVRQNLEMATVENVNLIKSIPNVHFSKVIQAVQDNFRGIKPEGLSLTKRLQQLGGITKNRAAFIARDQTSKINGALTQARHEAIGIDSYIWVTAGDERVVGTPGGLYPRGNSGHGNHFKRDNKIFRYDKPPFDGAPGQAYNYRCVQKPQIDLDKLITNLPKAA